MAFYMFHCFIRQNRVIYLNVLLKTKKDIVLVLIGVLLFCKMFCKMCQSNGVMLSHPSSSLEDYSCKVNTKALSLTDSANYITTENRKVRHLSISSQPRKPHHKKINNTNNNRYYFALCLAFENNRRSSVVGYSDFV